MLISINIEWQLVIFILSLCVYVTYYTDTVIENRNQTHGKFDGLTFVHRMWCIEFTAWYNRRRKLSSSADRHAWFRGNWNTENRIIEYKVPTIPVVRFLFFYVLTQKISRLNCTEYSRAKHIYITRCLPRLLNNTIKPTVLLNPYRTNVDNRVSS